MYLIKVPKQTFNSFLQKASLPVVRCAEHKSRSWWRNGFVGYEEPAIAERVCSVIVQMLESDAVMDAVLITAAMESIWFVLQVNGPTPVHHFCRLFAKAGLVPQLLASLRSLCACSALTTSPQAQGHRYRNSHDFKSGAALPGFLLFAEMSVMSPRKLFIFNIYKNYFLDQSIQKTFSFRLKTDALTLAAVILLWLMYM